MTFVTTSLIASSINFIHAQVVHAGGSSWPVAVLMDEFTCRGFSGEYIYDATILVGLPIVDSCTRQGLH